MTQVRTDAARRLRPYWGRILVAVSTVDEEQLASGLIVPFNFSDEEPWLRGVVLSTAADGDPADRLEPGTVVYFAVGYSTRILDTYVVEPQGILAYESDE